MAQVESYQTSTWILGDEELLAFVRDMDNNWLLEIKPPATPDCAARLSTTKFKKKQRRNRKVEILNIHQEIIDLQDRLQMLQKQHELRDSVGATESSGRGNWHMIALHQQMHMKRASKENTRLLKQVQARARLVQRIIRLINRQEIASMPRAVQLDHRITSVDNPAHVYHVMNACLDIRSQSALGAILSQCNDSNLRSANELRKFRWRSFAMTPLCVGVEFQESVVMPFSSPFIHDVLYRHPVLINAIEIHENKFVEKITHKPIPSQIFPQRMPTYVATTSDRQLVLRRLVTVQNSKILLWENASCWRKDGHSPSVLVRGSGWGVITPAPAEKKDLSVIHIGGFIQIYAMDGSRLSPTDELTKDAVAHAQSLQKSRLTCLEDVLLDAYRCQ